MRTVRTAPSSRGCSTSPRSARPTTVKAAYDNGQRRHTTHRQHDDEDEPRHVEGGAEMPVEPGPRTAWTIAADGIRELPA